jgi:hypothetical protein
MIWLIVAVLVACLAFAIVTVMTQGAHRHDLDIYMAQRKMNDIKRRTVRAMYDGEARYRQAHGDDDVIEGSVVGEE